MSVTLGSAFAGIGGWELGLSRSIPGLKTIWQIESDPFCRRILARHWPDAIRYGDITTLDMSRLESPDILAAGFPCTDISLCGGRTGLKGEKSGLWYNLWEIIRFLRCRVVLLENVAAITGNGLREIGACFASIGYDLEWTVISASGSVGAPHLRRRWFAVAYPHSLRAQIQAEREQSGIDLSGGIGPVRSPHWESWPTLPGICGVNDGISHRLDRVRSLGNAIVPQIAELIGQLVVRSGLL